MNLVTAIVLALFASPTRADEDAKKALEGLQGEWKVVEFVKGGEAEEKDRIKDAKVAFAGATMTLMFGGKKEEATVSLDPKAKIAGIDIKGKGEPFTTKGIYKIDKDRLTICFGLDGEARPTEFKGAKNNGLMVLERVKK